MRNTVRIIKPLFLCLILSVTFLGCKKDKNSLPPETQVGINTFGCLLDGQIFKLNGNGGISPVYQCYYQQIYPSGGGYVFNVSGNMKGENCEIKSITIIVDSMKLAEGTYKMGKSVRGKFAGGYNYYKNCNTNVVQYVTSAVDTGLIVIKKLDEINNIVSGTFWFNATNSTGQVVQVRDGRFDMKFTR